MNVHHCATHGCEHEATTTVLLPNSRSTKTVCADCAAELVDLWHHEKWEPHLESMDIVVVTPSRETAESRAQLWAGRSYEITKTTRVEELRGRGNGWRVHLRNRSYAYTQVVR